VPFIRYCDLKRTVGRSISLSVIGLLVLSLFTVTSFSGLKALATENNTANLWIGITMADPGPALIQKLGLNKSTGVAVTEVIPGGPAEIAGIRSPDLRLDEDGKSREVLNADIILKVDNRTVQNPEDIGSAIETKNAGENVTLTIFRAPQIKDISLTPIPKPSYLVFKDPDALYTVKYPANWTVGKTDLLQQLAQKTQILDPEKLQQVGVVFFLKPNELGKSISIIRNPGRVTGLTDIQMKDMLDEHFGRALIQENGTIVQDIECEKFRIDGGKACSYIIGVGEGETVQQVLQILTVIGERIYSITYGSSPENFDKDLPVFETMLKSLNGTDTAVARASSIGKTLNTLGQ
jgi:PDZ domain-containing protein